MGERSLALIQVRKLSTGRNSSAVVKAATFGLPLLIVVMVIIVVFLHWRRRRALHMERKAGTKDRIRRERRARRWWESGS